MALILIRGENKLKLLNSINDIVKHGNLSLISKPKLLNIDYVNSIVEKILSAKLKNKAKIAIAFFVEETDNLAISKIKNIHPPAHVIVVSEEYNVYDDFLAKLKEGTIFEEFQFTKSTTKTKDYKALKSENSKVITENINHYE